MAVEDIINEITEKQQAKNLTPKPLEYGAFLTLNLTKTRWVIVDNKGFCIVEQTQKGYKKQNFSPLPVWPVEMLTPYDENRPYIVLEGRGMGGESIIKTTVPMAALAQPGAHREAFKALTDAGFPMFEKAQGTQQTLARALLDVVSELANKKLLPQKRGAINVGWHFPSLLNELENITITEPVHIVPGTSEYIGGMPAIFEKKGTGEAWEKAIKEGLRGSPVLALILAAACGAYLRGWIEIESKILHIHGASSMGKTLAMRFAASITGMTKSGYLVNSWDASRTAFEALAEEGVHHGFVCLDEAHAMLATARNPLDLLMKMTNDDGALRGRQSGGLREKRSWNVTILSTGNIDLTHVGDGTAQKDAIKARVLEIDVSEHPVFAWSDSNKAAEFEKLLSDNYGHGYERIIKAIKENHDAYIERYNNVAKTISGQAAGLGESGNVSARRGKGWALIAAGLDILGDIIELDESMDETMGQAWGLIGTLAGQGIEEAHEANEEKAENIIEELRAFVMGNINYFYIKGHWFNPYVSMNESPDEWSNQQKNAANNISSQCKQMLGMIEQAETMNEAGAITGKVYISTTAGNTIKNCVDLADLARRADDAGILIKQAGQGSRRFIKKRGLGNAYAFDLGNVPF